MTTHECRFGGTTKHHETFLTVFKVHGGNAIQMWPDEFKNISSISNGDICHHVHQDDVFMPINKRSVYASLSSSISSLGTISDNSEVKNIDEDKMADFSDEDNRHFEEELRESRNRTGGFNSEDKNLMQTISSDCKSPCIHYKFRLAHHHDNHESVDEDHIKMFVLQQPARESDQCHLHDQCKYGQVFDPNDLAIYITEPVVGNNKVTYAIDFSVSGGVNDDLTETRHIGTAYLYLEPRFSTHGIQRTPIIGTHKSAPIGQIKIEYLIITNPLAYELDCPKPDWLLNKQMDAGHRGAGSGRRTDLPGDLLENTIASFNYAADHGADMCELDIFVSHDGIPVVYHDFDVDAVTAHQSSDEIGKFRVQVNEFTVKQLRDFRLMAMHQDGGEMYTLDVPNQPIENRPFPTLAEVLDLVNPACGFNIELKWPQVLESGQWEAKKYREMNEFVDKVLDVVMRHAKDRRIVLQCFEADIVIM